MLKFPRTRRSLAGVGAVAAVACLTLFVVLPAVASTPGHTVLPTSSAGITPTDVGIGGNGVCSSIFPKLASLQNVHEYDNPNPQSTAGPLPSGNGDNATFALTLSGSNAKQRLQVTASSNAVMAAIGIKGGNDTAAYDYNGKDFGAGVTQRFVTTDGNLHAPASKFSVDNSGLETPTQWYGISQLNACYRLTASISGRVYDAGTDIGISAAQEVTVVDNTTGGTTTLDAGSGGTFSSRQPIGDSYTVCAKFPSGYGTQSTPTLGAACPAGYAPLGYTFTLASGGSSTSNFGFLALRTISGELYQDSNLNGTYDPNGALTPHDQAGATGWTVKLYDTTPATPTLVGSGSTTTTTTPPGGAPYNFKFSASIVPNDSYKLCVIPSQPDASTVWVQTQPAPQSNATCTAPPALQWAAAFTGGSTDVTQDFGVAQGFACSSSSAFGSGGVLALMPAAAGGGCLKPNTFAFANGVDPTNNNKNYIGVAVGDPTHSSEFAPVVEKITFSDPLKADGSPTFTGLEYIAGSVTAPRRMPSCAPSGVLDPTNTADYGLGAPSDLLLAHAYTAMRTSDTGAPVLPGSVDTACLISITITGSSGTPGTGTLTAYAYFAADSKAWPT